MADLVFPEAREALFRLMDGLPYGDDAVVSSFFVLPEGWEDNHLPAANIWVQRGTQGFLDRTDWVAVDVYAPPGEAVSVAELIGRRLVGEPHDVAGVGFIDSIEYEQTPRDIPYPSDRVSQAQMVLRVTARPA